MLNAETGLDAAGDALVSRFFEALPLRDFERCEAVVVELATQPGGAPWCVYLEAVLANERDYDFGRAEALLSGLLAVPQPPALESRARLALGRTYDYQGRWGEAISAYEACLPRFAAQNHQVDEARVWKQIAIALRNGFAQGDFGPEVLPLAERHCRHALALLGPAESASDDVAWLIGSIWNTLGAIAMNRGAWAEAASCYRRDIAIAERLDDQHGRGVSLLNLGEIFHALGQWDNARAAYAEALPLMRRFGDRFLAADVLANQAVLLQAMGDAVGALAAYDEAVQAVEALRAGVSSAEARAAFFATSADTFANAVLHSFACGELAVAFNYVERARSRAFLDSLAARASDLAEQLDMAPFDLAAVQSALCPGDLLLEYFTTGLVEARQNRPGAALAHRHRFPPPRALLFAITADGVAAFDLACSPNDLLPARLDSVVERHFLRPQVRRALYKQLLAPVRAQVRAARRLFIVPHGPLHYIPFHALVGPDGADLLAEGGPELMYGPSATLLLQPTAATPTPERPMLAIGANGVGATRLRFAEEEARAVALLTNGDILIGRDLRVERLLQLAEKYGLIHFSCHGSFDPDQPLASALQLGPEEQLSAMDVIEHLRLRCALVTLSACESGLSRVRRGDELMGLVRAFRYAGAAAVLCTLWRVDERSTRIFMELFYRRVREGASYAAALRQAQLELRGLSRGEARLILVAAVANELLTVHLKGSVAPVDHLLVHGPDDERPFADPYYWAPFVLIGAVSSI